MQLNSTNRRRMLTLICGAIAATRTEPTHASVRLPDSARQLIHDPRSGLALHGYDPVAYHSEHRARLGREVFATEMLGYVWRFITSANREAFREAAEQYLPLFGGHDARGVAEGRMVEGDPTIFLIAGDRTVFFRSIEDRAAFADNAEMRRTALKSWPDVARQFAAH
jgi:hypothetical protein